MRCILDGALRTISDITGMATQPQDRNRATRHRMMLLWLGLSQETAGALNGLEHATAKGMDNCASEES